MSETIAKPKMHTFHTSLKTGQAGELLWSSLIKEFYPEYKLDHNDGRKHDFTLRSPFGPFTLELKTDSYDMTKTQNVFMEKYSNWDKKSPGGPWQSQSKNIDLYCYWHPTNRIMLTYNVNLLVSRLEELNIKDSKLIPIMNRGFITKGAKVPREALHDICTRIYLGPESDDSGLC